MSKRRRRWESAVVLNDLHIPDHDPKAVALVEKFIAKADPDFVVLNGDILETKAVSKWPRNPTEESLENLQTEISTAKKWLARIRDLAPSAKIAYIEGNHEHRLKSYLYSNAPALAFLDDVSMPALLGLRGLEISYIHTKGAKWTDTYIRWGDLLIGHFDSCSKSAGATALKLLDKYGISLIQAHTHKQATVHAKGLLSGLIGGWENGCLCHLEPDYMAMANWSHGFCIVHKEVGGRFFQVEPISIVDYRMRYGGDFFDGRGK